MKFKAALKMGMRSWLMMVIMDVLVFMFFPALIAGNTAVRIAVNLAVTLASVLFAYANGATLGESEITYGELVQKRMDTGYKPTEFDRAKCYDRKRGILGTVLGILPWALIAVVVLVSGMGYVHELAEETPDYLFPQATDMVMHPHETIDVVARVAFAAFMGYYEFIDNMGPGLLDYFFLPFSLIYPLALYIGYLSGPRQHQKKLKMIEEGKKKKLRKIRADQKRKKRQQQSKQPKMEV